MTSGTLTNVLVIAVAAVAAPLLAHLLRHVLAMAPTVLEIGFGIVLGPALLGLVGTDDVVDALAGFGLAMLFFLAGYEIDAGRIRGRPLRQATWSWAGSLLLGLATGALLAAVLGGGPLAVAGLGLALTTTTLGTILPMVRDAGVLRGPLGTLVMAVGAVGEFGPIVMVALLFSGQRPLHATVLLLGFAAVAVATLLLARRPPPAWLAAQLRTTLGTSAQLAVRLSVLVVLAMVWVATELHLDLVLGAFAAGAVMRLVLASISRQETATVESKLEGLGFGLFIPFFFVTTGVRFDVSALVGSPAALALIPIGAAAFLVVRALPVVAAFRALPAPPRQALGLYAATALPLVVVITDSGVASGWLAPGPAAGLVGAAMLSVLLFPLLAQQRLAASGVPSQ